MSVLTNRQITRRDFFKIIGFAGISGAGLAYLDTYRPWINFEMLPDSNVQSEIEGMNGMEKQFEMIRLATMAANGHNAQPWLFKISENRIQIHPDYSRRLPVVDPDDRELWISLGCALENLVLAAAAFGMASRITYPESNEFIDVVFEQKEKKPDELFNVIPLRQNTRSLYDGRKPGSSEMTKLEEVPLEPGVSLKFLSEGAGFDLAADYIKQGTLIQYANKAFLKELSSWIRFNIKSATTSMDGLFSRCSGNPEVPTFIGKMFVEGMKPRQQADSDIKKLRSSAGVVVISSETDNRSDWVRTGRVYERLALKMTSLDMKSALLNQPVEVNEVRPEFNRALGLDSATAQLVLRYGYAPALPNSLRRPVVKVVRSLSQ